ncbi:MAG: group II intron reverse transcriptase/maturase [Minisyncoccia bacterium]
MSKRYNIDRVEGVAAWEAVRRAGGGAGIDGKTIAQVAARLDDELYKIWNRLSSGSYQAQPVKIVSIPKANGGVRKLGIPNVTDRVAQSIIKSRLEKEVDYLFHEDSYAYRKGRSAIDAVLKTRERCISRPSGWIIDLDIKGFFDNLDHDLMMEIVEKYSKDPVVVLYAKKFLKAEAIDEDTGEKLERIKGTPQGGVISPVLANLYLHEGFDEWMKKEFTNIAFARYADDIIVHCVSEKQAQFILGKIKNRLKQYKLEVSPEKTKIVYAGISNSHDHMGHKVPRKFKFLGYDFKPRSYKGKIVFTPGMGQGALLMMGEKIQKMRLNSLCHKPIEELAIGINRVSRGWIEYYGHCRKSEMYKLASLLDKRLVKYLKHKLKIASHGKAWDILKEMKKEKPKLFVHWYMIATSPQRAV